MFLQLFISLTFAMLLPIVDFGSSSDSCLESEISIKSAQSVYSSPIYQKVMTAYSGYRTLYGINVKVSGDMYSNRSQWNSLINSPDQSGLDFSVLDTELINEEKSAHPDFLAIPVAFGNFLFVYNLPGINMTLNMTMDTIVGVYLGTITRWNDTALQELNPSVKLPSRSIEVYAAANDTIQNYYLSFFFGAYSAEWRLIYGENPFFMWPPKINNSYSFATAQNLATSINSKSYSFGYITWSFLYTLKYTNVKWAKVVNVKYEQAISTLPSTVKSILGDTTINSETFNTLPNLVQNKELPYAFVYFQNVIVNKVSLKTRSCCKIQETLGFVEFFLDYYNDSAQMNGYFPMPDTAVKNIRSSLLSLVTCGGTNSLDEFRKYETMEEKAKRQHLIMVCVPTVLGIVLFFALLAFLGYYKRLKMIKETFWIIGINEIKFDEKPTEKYINKSSLSVRTGLSENGTALLSLNNRLILEKHVGRVALWTRLNSEVTVSLLNAKTYNHWKRNTKALIANFCKNVNHINISLLYGASNIEGKPYLVSQFCYKGTLNYVLSVCPYALSKDIKYSLANDVIQGLNYLHRKGIVHGNLSSFSCDVDDLWVVKLTNWSNYSLLSSECVRRPAIDVNQIDDNSTLVKLLYIDPEAWHPGFPTFASDVYSFGMLLIEIFTQKTPFFEEIELCIHEYSSLLRNKVDKVYDVPTMSAISMPVDLQSLTTMLLGASLARPTSLSVAKRLQELRGNTKKSIVDIVMKMLESYVAELEEKVIERTSELTQMTNRMKDLLNQLLPPQIASKFIKGESVEPEFFECATIFFSDIVGFTTISARSTPIQVMAFLNELWKEFDKTVESFDVYKVDTIGDAYMVASGLPTRNGINHCKCIADLALSLLRRTDTFSIPHLKEEKLKIRIGINSGPVTAGIVGFKMPQYCVFGDTVNTASRMESTGLPFKIQVSEYFYSLMTGFFTSYCFEYRGESEIKGKGCMKTYWLLGNGESR